MLQYAIRYTCQNLKFGICREARYSELPAQLLTLLTRIRKFQVQRCGGESTTQFSIYPLSLNKWYHSASIQIPGGTEHTRVNPKIRGICPLKKFTVTPSFHRLLQSSPLDHSCQQYPRGLLRRRRW
jgi:hypothetical protein